jgi:hypothetical protein
MVCRLFNYAVQGVRERPRPSVLSPTAMTSSRGPEQAPLVPDRDFRCGVLASVGQGFVVVEEKSRGSQDRSPWALSLRVFHRLQLAICKKSMRQALLGRAWAALCYFVLVECCCGQDSTFTCDGGRTKIPKAHVSLAEGLNLQLHQKAPELRQVDACACTGQSNMPRSPPTDPWSKENFEDCEGTQTIQDMTS